MVLLLGLALGCADKGVETGDTSSRLPSLEADLQPIFNRNCVGACHYSDAPSGGMDLSAGVAHSQLVDVASTAVPELSRVAPGEPDASYLVHKLEGTYTSVGGTGTRMPPELVLAPTELQLFRDWIAAGAAE